uniref:hypothetical protein n=1 Tax=uncultured Draconibacterium sp. TaxID=1573823 RepID=UPI0032171EF0
MITRKELNDFALFCLNNYNLRIHESVVDDFIVHQKSLQKSDMDADSPKNESIIECDLESVGCSHMAFNSAKCDGCVV